MLKIFIITAVRNIKRNFLLSAIKIAGLSTGILCFTITVVFYTHEFGYDEFPDSRNIYRYVHRVNLPEGMEEYAFTSAMTGAAIHERFTAVQSFCRVLLQPMSLRTEGMEVGFNEARFVFADSTFIQFFPFPISEGKTGSLLKEPFTMIISPRAAKKYFGDKSAVGNTLLANNNTVFKITGVYSENISKTHFGSLDFIASFTSLEPMGKKPGWANSIPATVNLYAKGFNTFYTYFLLAPNTPPAVLTEKFPAFIEEFRGQGKSERLKPTLQALKDIHLNSSLKYEIDNNGNQRITYVFLLIGSVILAISNINFINISISEFIKRSKSVGIQKVLGTTRKALVFSFLTEVFLLSLFSAVISIILFYTVLPSLNMLINRDLTIEIPKVLPFLLVISCISTLLSGLYPATYISRVHPIDVIRSRLSVGRSVGLTRNALLMLQLCISFGLVSGAVVVYRQIDFLLSKDLGYDTSNIIQINTLGTDGQILKTFKEQISRTVAIKNVASTSIAFGQPGFSFGIRLPESGDEERTYGVASIFVDPDYLKTMDLKMISGRFFEENILADSTENVVINETAANFLFDGDALGQKIQFPSIKNDAGGTTTMTVIGVVADYNHASLRQRIEPLALIFEPSRFNYLLTRYNGSSTHAVVATIEKNWKPLFPERVFEYTSLEQSERLLYKDEKSLGDLIAAFSAVAVGIATIGLFGIGLFLVQQKTREFGIRKVLGATTKTIYFLFGRPILLLLLVSFALSTPMSYYFANDWLSKYPYRIKISASVYAISFVIIFAIVTLALLYHLGKMSKLNPVDVLKEQ